MLYLLAASQKYEMTSVQSTIRAKVRHGEFPAPNGAEAFSAYVIALGKGLVQEMENAAHQTLHLPMTFEVLGEGLRLFDGGGLGHCVTLPISASAVETALFRASIHSSKSNLWDLQAFGLVVLKLSLGPRLSPRGITLDDRNMFSPHG